jgi:hypothetical protein
VTIPNPQRPIIRDVNFVVHLAMHKHTLAETFCHRSINIAFVQLLMTERPDFVGAPFLATHPSHMPTPIHVAVLVPIRPEPLR